MEEQFNEFIKIMSFREVEDLCINRCNGFCDRCPFENQLKYEEFLNYLEIIKEGNNV